MKRRTLLVLGPIVTLAALSLLAVAGAETTEIRPGVTISGTISSDDPLLEDGNHYDAFEFDGVAGQDAVISMESEDLDTYLMICVDSPNPEQAVAEDDDGGEGTNSRLRISLSEGARYYIIASGFSPEDTGAYTIFSFNGNGKSGGKFRGILRHH